MPNRFSAARATESVAARAARLAPGNPFLTAAYVRAQEMLGEEAWAFELVEADGTERMCFGYLKRGRLNALLRLPTVAALSAASAFWPGLDEFCRSQGVTQLEVATMGCPEAAIPSWRGETARIARTEFAFDLRADDLLANMSKGHKERIKKGRKNGLVIRRGHDDVLLDAHVGLHVNSMDRRRDRGESVPEDFPRQIPEGLLRTRAGELFQALHEEQVVSSLLVIRSATGAYSESSGNSPEGMTLGASHFLRYETSLMLRDEGVETFYFGGARPHETGLRSYKEGFGAVPLPMESIEAYLGSATRRKVATALSALRYDPRVFINTIKGIREQYVVFVVDPRTVTAPPAPEGWVVTKMTNAEIAALPATLPEIRAQGRRIVEGRENDAYALHIDGVLAGICWLIPSEHDCHYPVRNVKLRTREAEITHCVTLPHFRGRGVYPFMIQTLCEAAAKNGTTRLFMITNRQNEPSQRGILKAGFRQTGGIYRHIFPYLGRASITFRRHRWGALGWA